jgi:hypothetical protein
MPSFMQPQAMSQGIMGSLAPQGVPGRPPMMQQPMNTFMGPQPIGQQPMGAPMGPQTNPQMGQPMMGGLPPNQNFNAGYAPQAQEFMPYGGDAENRAQFSNFMSGLDGFNQPQTPPLGQPMAQTGPQMEQFQYPVAMEAGGVVDAPRTTDVRGQFHKLAYINRDEEALLRGLGGTGESGPKGIPAFPPDGSGYGGYGTESSSTSGSGGNKDTSSKSTSGPVGRSGSDQGQRDAISSSKGRQDGPGSETEGNNMGPKSDPQSKDRDDGPPSKNTATKATAPDTRDRTQAPSKPNPGDIATGGFGTSNNSNSGGTAKPGPSSLDSYTQNDRDVIGLDREMFNAINANNSFNQMVNSKDKNKNTFDQAAIRDPLSFPGLGDVQNSVTDAVNLEAPKYTSYLSTQGPAPVTATTPINPAYSTTYDVNKDRLAKFNVGPVEQYEDTDMSPEARLARSYAYGMDLEKNPPRDKFGNPVAPGQAKFLDDKDWWDGGGKGRAGPDFQTNDQQANNTSNSKDNLGSALGLTPLGSGRDPTGLAGFVDKGGFIGNILSGILNPQPLTDEQREAQRLNNERMMSERDGGGNGGGQGISGGIGGGITTPKCPDGFIYDQVAKACVPDNRNLVGGFSGRAETLDDILARQGNLNSSTMYGQSTPTAPQIVIAPQRPSAPVLFMENGGNPMVEKIMAAIRAQESEGSGGYSAVGQMTPKGNRAYGADQVMDFNVGPWTEKHFGKKLTPQEFLANKEAQDAVARGEIGRLFEQYQNPEDVASVWYSGKPLKGNTNFDKTSNQDVPSYVASVMARIGAQGGEQTQEETAANAIASLLQSSPAPSIKSSSSIKSSGDKKSKNMQSMAILNELMGSNRTTRTPPDIKINPAPKANEDRLGSAVNNFLSSLGSMS